MRPGRSGGELSAAIAITGAGVTGLPVIRTAPRLTSIATTSSKLPAETPALSQSTGTAYTGYNLRQHPCSSV